MIVGVGNNIQDGKGKALLIGLSVENLVRLAAGEPIHLSQLRHGQALPPGWEIVVVAAATEEAIVEALREAKVVTAGTEVHTLPSPDAVP